MSKKQVYLNVTATIAFIQHEIVKLIKRFKFEELETSIMPIFPEVSWNNIRSELVKTHNKFTTANVAQLIKIAMIEANLDVKVVLAKKEGAISSENINQSLMYKDISPERRKTGVDFTQQKHRKRYMEKCFGEDPPTLELLVINGPSMPVKSTSTNLPNENIRATWEFRSHNIATYLTKLIERRILITPVPYYISNLMILGKNELTLQRD
ncbi:hypothetical protein ANTPLA_LOCUS78 [Anthophora plagiata]